MAGRITSSSEVWAPPDASVCKLAPVQGGVEVSSFWAETKDEEAELPATPCPSFLLLSHITQCRVSVSPSEKLDAARPLFWSLVPPAPPLTHPECLSAPRRGRQTARDFPTPNTREAREIQRDPSCCCFLLSLSLGEMQPQRARREPGV